MKTTGKNWVLAITMVALTSFGSLSIAGAASVNWGSGTWDNGSGLRTGYLNGSTQGTTISDGIQIDVSYVNTGVTADPTNLTVSGTLSGGTGIPTLRLQQSGDRNTGSTLEHYSTITLDFNQEVELLAPFSIYDVDLSSASTWIDFIVVTAYLSGVQVGTTYTTSAAVPPYNTTGTLYGLDGVVGLRDGDNSSAQGNVGINFVGSFDSIVITFTQGALTSGSGSSHGIGISNISVQSVPEPSVAAMGLLGVAALLIRARNRAKRH